VATWAPLLVCAAAALVAAAIVVGATAVSLPREEKPVPFTMHSLLAVSVALGIALGLVEVAVPAAATRWGDATYSGILLGMFALGSVGGGLWFGHRHWRRPAEQRYLLAVVAL